MLHTMIHSPVHCRSLIWRRELNRYGYTSKILKQYNTEVEGCKAFLMRHNTSFKEPSKNFARVLHLLNHSGRMGHFSTGGGGSVAHKRNPLLRFVAWYCGPSLAYIPLVKCVILEKSAQDYQTTQGETGKLQWS